jgi:hypothetical protein
MTSRTAKFRKRLKHPPLHGVQGGLPLTVLRRKPSRLRYGLAVLAVLALVFGWSEWGEHGLFALHLGSIQTWQAKFSRYRVMITPPDYTGFSPVILTAASRAFSGNDPVRVPEGSGFDVHVSDNGTAPSLEIDGRTLDLVAEGKGDFKTTEKITSGETIALRQGHHTLGAWRVQIIPATPPRITLIDPPIESTGKTTRLSYEASDDYGIQTIAVRMTPVLPEQGARNEPVDVVIATPQAKTVKQVDFQDLTFSPWAGAKVEIQLVAKNAAGRTALSEKKIVTLPERVFQHPLARALVEERKKLLRQDIDIPTRDEAANIMAGIARQPTSYRHDPVVLMALRTGAVRLVLDHDDDAMPAVGWLLWQAAVRIEEGATGHKQASLE